MKNIRYFFLMLFVLAPAFAFAQTTDDVIEIQVGSETYDARGAAFGTPFVEGTNIGPLDLVLVEPFDACNDSGAITNAAALAGNIAVVTRGTCAFVEKVTNVSATGAAAIILQNCESALAACSSTDDDAIILQAGDCESVRLLGP